MQNRSIRIINLFVIALAILLASCDHFEEDLISTEKQVNINASATDFYLLPNTSIVIDLKPLVSSSFTSGALKVSENPKRGKLISLGELLSKYEPSSSFNSGEDQFNVSITGGDGRVLRVQTITIHMHDSIASFPCNL